MMIFFLGIKNTFIELRYSFMLIIRRGQATTAHNKISMTLKTDYYCSTTSLSQYWVWQKGTMKF